MYEYKSPVVDDYVKWKDIEGWYIVPFVKKADEYITIEVQSDVSRTNQSVNTARNV